MRKIFSIIAVICLSVSVYALQPPVVNVAEAVEIGMGLEAGGVTETEYTVEGYVINAESFSLMYRNQTWGMADEADAASSDFKAYHCYPIDNGDTIKVLNGDKVSVYGKIKKYVKNDQVTIEIEQGDAAFIEKAEGDHTVYEMTAGITVGRALQIGAELEDNGTSINQYAIRGYISSIATPFSQQYKNQSFWVTESNDNSHAASNAEGAFYVFQGKPETEAELPVGTCVEFITTIKKYVPAGGGEPVIENADKNIIIRVVTEAPEDAADVIFRGEDFYGQGQAATETTPGGTVTATKDGVTFTCNNAYGDQYGVRCYAESQVSIVSEGEPIGRLVFEFGSANGKYYNGGLENEIIVNASEWNNTMVSQARMNKIKVYLGEIEPEEGIEQVVLSEKARKVLSDGVLYIVRDGKLYNLQGVQIR